MKRHYPRKRFGQHFLRDPQVLQAIVSAINPQQADHLLEIGPGEGVLTGLLLPHCQHLDVVEIDNDLVSQLQWRFKSNHQLAIHHQDILNFDLSALEKNQLRVVGNLPYNISSPLLFKLFEQLDRIQDMHFMLQKEVVLRMTASVSSHHYGRLAVMTQYFCQAVYLFDVGPNAFSPPPKVDSAVVRLLPQTPPEAASDINTLSYIVKAAFMYRRKTLRNSLAQIIGETDLVGLNIDPNQRPQDLDIKQFVKISNFLDKKAL